MGFVRVDAVSNRPFTPQSPVLLVRVPALVASGLTCSPFVTIRGRLNHFQELIGNKISPSGKSWMTTATNCGDRLP
ncbi:hypothetical protein [Nostoc sp.]|uniref:hypothetical protein n=1 Tax=Nostoc sp. TaxID=1180 RepID=UPI002FEEA40E